LSDSTAHARDPCVDGTEEAQTPRVSDNGGPVKLRIAYLKVGLAVVALASFVVAVGAPSKFR